MNTGWLFAFLLATIFNSAFSQTTNATCIASGDPHYLTFDGEMIDYQGLCKHLLVKSTSDAPEQFEVYVKNEGRGSAPVSYVQYVEVYWNEVTIRISRNSQNNPVTVTTYIARQKPHFNMRAVGLPMALLPFQSRGFNVWLTSSFFTLTTSFGLVVEYDGNHLVKVTLNSTFTGKVTGMCGNFDGDASNDLKTADGQSVAGVLNGHSQIGNSYVVKNDPEKTSNSSCDTMDLIPLDTCRGPVKEFYNYTCSYLLNATGPLKDCMAVTGMDVARKFYKNCINDACNTLDSKPICRTFYAYLQLCPKVVWDNLSTNLGCRANPCVLSGDPHIGTWDRLMLDYQGTCKLLVVKTTNPLLPQFSVYVKNERRNEFPVSYVTYFEIYFGDVTHRIWRDSLTGETELYVASGPPPHDMKTVGVNTKMPYKNEDILIEKSAVGAVSVATSYGLVALFDGDHTLKLTLPTFYMNQVTGMCGNFDLNSKNDLTTATGENVTGKANAHSMVGNSYIMHSDPETTDESTCSAAVDIDPVAECNADKKPYYTKQCSQLTNTTGPFKSCIQSLGNTTAEQYNHNCLYDACATNDYSSVCSTFETFLFTRCTVTTTTNWRETLGCPLKKTTTAGSTQGSETTPPTIPTTPLV